MINYNYGKRKMTEKRAHSTASAKRSRTIAFIREIIRPHSRTMLLGIVFLIMVNIALLFLPYFFSNIIDSIILEVNGTQSFSLASRSMLYTFLLFGVSIIIFFLRLGWRKLLIIPSYKIENTLKKQLFRHFLQFCQKTQQSISVGEQVSLVERETNQLTQAISWGTLALADGLFTVVSVYTILIVWYREIAWASLLVYPLSLVYVYILFGKLGKQYERIQGKIAGISELTREMFENIATIKSHNSELFYENKFTEKGKDILKTQIHISFLSSLLWPLLILVNGISLALTLYLGIRAHAAGTASIGDIFAVINYIGQVELPFLGLGFAFDIQQKGLSNVRRIRRSLKLEPSVINNSHSQTQMLSGQLDIENLSFSYDEIHADILNKEQKRVEDKNQFLLGPITLSLEKGTWLGITGRIGSGKSTLAKLITRIYEIKNAAAIRWDGYPIQQIELESFRKQVFYQAQDFHLFSISIAQNIVFKEDMLTKADTAQAVNYGTYSALENDVRVLPQEWDTQIGEAGILLSGGQKQRVTLARTLFANAAVLVLDDIFSGLDNKTSKEVLKNLIQLRRQKTTIIISHNLPIISNTDRILVMEEGKIVEDGRHFELLKNANTLYAQNWKEYLKDQGDYYE